MKNCFNFQKARITTVKYVLRKKLLKSCFEQYIGRLLVRCEADTIIIVVV